MCHCEQTEWCFVLDFRGLNQKGGGSELERVDVEDEEERYPAGEAEAIKMTETANTTATKTDAGAECQMVALAANNYSNLAQLG